MNITEYEKNLDRASEWIKSVDQKVSIFLAFQGLVITSVFSFLFKLLYSECLTLISVIAVFAIFGMIIGIVNSVLVITPVLNNNTKKSILYFNDVSSMSISQYKDRVKKMTKEEYEDTVLDQTFVLSSIASRKHELFRNSIIWFFGGFSLIILIIVIA